MRDLFRRRQDGLSQGLFADGAVPDSQEVRHHELEDADKGDKVLFHTGRLDIVLVVLWRRHAKAHVHRGVLGRHALVKRIHARVLKDRHIQDLSNVIRNPTRSEQNHPIKANLAQDNASNHVQTDANKDVPTVRKTLQDADRRIRKQVEPQLDNQDLDDKEPKAFAGFDAEEIGLERIAHAVDDGAENDVRRIRHQGDVEVGGVDVVTRWHVLDSTVLVGEVVALPAAVVAGVEVGKKDVLELVLDVGAAHGKVVAKRPKTEELGYLVLNSLDVAFVHEAALDDVHRHVVKTKKLGSSCWFHFLVIIYLLILFSFSWVLGS